MGDLFKADLYKIEEKKVVDTVDIKTAVIYRLNDLINQKDITVNEDGGMFWRSSFNIKEYFVWSE